MTTNKEWIVTRIRELKNYLNQIYFGKSNLYQFKILGIILFTLGVGLFWNPLGVNNKFGITLIFISIFIFIFFPEKSIQNHNDIYIFSFLITWLIIMAFITNNTNLDTFFFSVVLGMLIIKEFANGHIRYPLKKKLSVLTLIFFSLSMILVVEKVISFFNM